MAHSTVRADHRVLKATIDLGQIPAFAVPVLDPLVVADGHAAGVCEQVGDDPDAATVEDLFATPCGRSVRAFGHELHVERARFFGPDLALERRRNEEVRARAEELRTRD